MKLFYCFFVLCLATCTCLAQSSGIDIPKEIHFSTAISYDRAEPTVKKSMQWITTHPIDADPAEHKRLAAYVFKWLDGTDKVSAAIDADLMKYTDQNSRLIMVFLSAWGLYELENGKNATAAKAAGMDALVQSYQNATVKNKDRDLEKLIRKRGKQGK